LLDGKVLPGQYLPERIVQPDVQALLRKVKVHPAPEFSLRFPDEMPSRVRITLRDGQVFTREKHDYEGFRTRPMEWELVVSKFEQLSQPHLSPNQQHAIEETVLHIDDIQIHDLTTLLGRNGQSD